ncbi:MAG: ATP-binding protein [Actinomycetia bacterium]|nr:ATP-binding protein [Actinomycetes bacterium]
MAEEEADTTNAPDATGTTEATVPDDPTVADRPTVLDAPTTPDTPTVLDGPDTGDGPGAVAGNAYNLDIGGDAQGPVVVGDHNLLVDAQHGSSVTLLVQGQRPDPVRRDRVALLPRRQQEPVGRAAELAALEQGLREGGLVQLHGPSGSGTSMLLRHAAHRPAPGPDGRIYLNAAEREVADLAQEVFEACYDAVGYAPSETELRRLMAGVRVTVYLDNADLTREQALVLADFAPDASFVLASHERSLLGEDGTLVELAGLDRAAGLDLLARELRRPLAEDELDAATALWEAARGRPLQLLRAASLARFRGPTDGRLPLPGEVAELLPLLLDGLDGPSAAVLRVLATLEGAEVAPSHIGALAELPDAAPVCERLAELGLVRAEEHGYRCAQDAVPAVLGRSAGPFPVDRICAHFTGWLADPATTPAEVAAHSRALEQAAALAEATGRPDLAVRITRAASPAMARSLRFRAWGGLLGLGWRAAQRAGDRQAETYFVHEEGIRSLLTGRRVIAAALLAEAALVWKALGDMHGATAALNAQHFAPTIPQQLPPHSPGVSGPGASPAHGGAGHSAAGPSTAGHSAAGHSAAGHGAAGHAATGPGGPGAAAHGAAGHGAGAHAAAAHSAQAHAVASHMANLAPAPHAAATALPHAAAHGAAAAAAHHAAGHTGHAAAHVAGHVAGHAAGHAAVGTTGATTGIAGSKALLITLAVVVVGATAAITVTTAVGGGGGPKELRAPFDSAVESLAHAPGIHYKGDWNVQEYTNEVTVTAHGEKFGTSHLQGDTMESDKDAQDLLSVGGKDYSRWHTTDSLTSDLGLWTYDDLGDHASDGNSRKSQEMALYPTPAALARKFTQALADKPRLPSEKDPQTTDVNGVPALRADTTAGYLYVSASAPYRVLRWEPPSAMNFKIDPSSTELPRAMEAHTPLSDTSSMDLTLVDPSGTSGMYDSLEKDTKDLAKARYGSLDFTGTNASGVNCDSAGCHIKEVVSSDVLADDTVVRNLGQVDVIMSVGSIDIDGRPAGTCTSEPQTMQVSGSTISGTLTCDDPAGGPVFDQVNAQYQGAADASGGTTTFWDHANDITIEALVLTRDEVDRLVAAEEQERNAS